jgi:glutamyl-tRNA reductase
MEIFVLGANYKTADVNIREKLIISDETLKKLYQIDEVRELIFLSTCNRVEFYGVSNEPDKAIEKLLSHLSTLSGIPKNKLKKHLYIYKGRDAIKHIFRVISSLDSMVIGEPQIVKQVREAFEKGKKLGTTGLVLDRLKNKAIQVSKKVRTSTGISKKAVSISYVAVELAKKIFDTLEDKSVLLIGAGEMAELAARHLVSKRVKHIFISNRTYEKAVQLSNEFGGSTIRFEKLKDFLPEVDIVIVSTGAKEPILNKEDFKRALKKRKGRPIFVIDISVPRNVADDVNELSDVYLYNIDDLKEIAERNLESRKLAAETAELIIEKDAIRFERWLRQLKASPVIAELTEFSQRIVDYQLEKLFKQLGNLSEEEQEIVKLAVNSIVKKLLHRPITYLKNKTANEENGEFIKEFEAMFLKQKDGLNIFNIKNLKKDKKKDER